MRWTESNKLRLGRREGRSRPSPPRPDAVLPILRVQDPDLPMTRGNPRRRPPHPRRPSAEAVVARGRAGTVPLDAKSAGAPGGSRVAIGPRKWS